VRDLRLRIPEILAAQRERRRAGVRRTSKAVYERLEKEGAFKKRRGKVYQFLFWNGPLTATETIAELDARSIRKGSWRANSSGRFTELRSMHLLREVGQTTCTVTGEKTILWDVTDREPGPLPRRVEGLTRNQLIERVEELEQEVEELEQENDELRAKIRKPITNK
jgi:hypothetical protein